MARRVLIVSQDVALRAAIAQGLRSEGHRIELADGPRRMREVIAAGDRIDLAVVAAAQFGSAAAAMLRDLHTAVPRLLVLSDRPVELERLTGPLPDGATALPYPTDSSALLASIEAALAASATGGEASAPPLLSDGRTLDLDGRVFLDADGRAVELTRTEFLLLADLIRHAGRVRSREQLRGAVAGEELEAFERSIDMHVSRLRRKIEPDPRRPRFVVTVPSVGYKFAARVHRGITAPPLALAAPVAQTPSPVPPERRRLTVLVCSIEGFAALSKERDPEEVGEAAAALWESCAAIVARFGGTMVRSLGDGLTAYFGYPQAHEDDIERAIRAGLALAQALEDAGCRLQGELASRIGIATGSAVVGDVGIGTGGEPTAVGEASWLAARLLAAAAPGWVVVAAEARRGAGRSFTYRQLDPARLASAGEAITAWRVTGPGAHLGRFAARRGGGLTQFAGRTEELAMLQQRWRQARGGAGQVVLLTGDPGIGKSRLARELHKSIGAEAHIPIRFFASPHDTDTPLFPVLRHLERAALFRRDDGPETKLDKLRRLLHWPSPLAEQDLPMLANLLSVPCRDEPHPHLHETSPQWRKEAIFAMLRRMLDRLTATQPVLMLWEDAQWLDSLSLELLASEVDRVARRPVLILVTARPGFKPLWPAHAHVREFALGRLDGAEAEALIRHVGGDDLRAATVRNIIDRGDGVPLFLEELAKSKLLRGMRGGRVPQDLQGLLLARIDGLGPVSKEVAQLGAGIGRRFSHELLALLEPGEHLDAGLAELVGAGLVFRRGIPPEASYEFKHALVRDAAYGTLSERRRRDLHARIAASLEANFPDIVEAQPESLAHHHAESGANEAAARYLLRAAQRALRASAATSTVGQLSRGLKLLDGLPASRRRDALAFRLYGALGTGYALAKGYAAPEAGDAYAAAARLIEAAEDSAEAMRVLWGNWVNLHVRGRIAEDVAQVGEIRAAADRYGDPLSALIADAIEGSAAFYSGRPRHALEAYGKLLAATPARELLEFYPTNHRVNAITTAAITCWILGRPTEAAALIDQADEEARALRHDFTLAWALVWASMVHLLDGDFERAGARLEEGRALAARRELPYLLGLAAMMQGWLVARRGDPRRGIVAIQDGLQTFEATGAAIVTGFFRVVVAELLCECGRLAEARDTAAHARQQMTRWGERWYEPELGRVEAELLAADPLADAAAIKRAYRRAIAAARRQEARGWEQRARTGLARWLAGHAAAEAAEPGTVTARARRRDASSAD